MARTPHKRTFDVYRFAGTVYSSIKDEGLTHEQAAEKCGVYCELFSKMKNAGQAPSVDAFLNICAAFGLDPMDYKTIQSAPKQTASGLFAGLMR